jgi:predicted RecB family nuclease
MHDSLPTIAALAASNPDGFITGKKTVLAGIGSDRLRLFQARAAMLKASPPKPYLRAPVILNLFPVELFFDIEVDPLRGVCYLHGFIERRDGDNATERFVSFFAEEATPAAECDAFAAALDYLSERADAAIYFYSKYERTIYRKLQQKYPNICTPEDVDRLFDPPRSVDLYGDVVRKATEWPTRDHSIKTLARYLGFTWRDTHPSGAASIEWFDRWCRERNPEIRQRILDYNEDDCRATRVLLDGIETSRPSCRRRSLRRIACRSLAAGPNPSLRRSLPNGDAADNRPILDGIEQARLVHPQSQKGADLGADGKVPLVRRYVGGFHAAPTGAQRGRCF